MNRQKRHQSWACRRVTSTVPSSSAQWEKMSASDVVRTASGSGPDAGL
jgi:hypothetical protein